MVRFTFSTDDSGRREKRSFHGLGKQSSLNQLANKKRIFTRSYTKVTLSSSISPDLFASLSNKIQLLPV